VTSLVDGRHGVGHPVNGRPRGLHHDVGAGAEQHVHLVGHEAGVTDLGQVHRSAGLDAVGIGDRADLDAWQAIELGQHHAAERPHADHGDAQRPPLRLADHQVFERTPQHRCADRSASERWVLLAGGAGLPGPEQRVIGELDLESVCSITFDHRDRELDTAG